MSRPGLSKSQRPSLLLTTALLLILPGSALAEVWTVGATKACDYQDLQAAVDAAAVSPASEKILRIAKDQTYTNVHLEIHDTSLRLVGGYTSCIGTQVGRTRLSGAGDLGTVVDIRATTHRQTVALENLEISGGRDGGLDSGEGVFIRGWVDVAIESTIITDNEGDIAGGVHVSGDLENPASLTLHNTTISLNRSERYGGGISCSGAAEVLGLGANAIIWNQVPQPSTGGGIHAAKGCRVRLQGEHLIAFNTAVRGAGIHATRSDLELISNSDGSVVVMSNWAEWDAAGIYVTDQSSLTARDVRIVGNVVSSGHGQGGGLSVTTGSVALVEGAAGAGCPGSGRCSVIENNTAGYTAAVSVGPGSQALIRRTWIRYHHGGSNSILNVDNRLPAVFGHTSLTLESVVLHDNVANSLVRTWGEGEALLNHVTTADNAVVTVVQLHDFATDEGILSGSARLEGSVVWELAGTDVFRSDPEGTYSADCNLVSDTATLPAGSDALIADPGFVDPTVGNYHLRFSSAAIDFCAEPTDPSLLDVDGEERGVDAAGIPSRVGGATVDAGADEYGSAPPALFRDGFESGDLSGWAP